MRSFPFWVFPLISITIWLAMLLTMLIRWCVIGRPFYISEDPHQKIAFISDIGASSLKPLFITGCCITSISLDLSLASERWLYSQRNIGEARRRVDIICGMLSIGFAAVGTLALILLSILDVVHYRTIHESLLIVAIVGYLISAAFLCWERRKLRSNLSAHNLLAISFYIKIIFVVAEIVIGAAFCVCFARFDGPAAVLEWAIAFFFILYASAFLLDLQPEANRTNKKGHAIEQETGGGAQEIE